MPKGPGQMWLGRGTDVARSWHRCGQVVEQMWPGPAQTSLSYYVWPERHEAAGRGAEAAAEDAYVHRTGTVATGEDITSFSL